MSSFVRRYLRSSLVERLSLWQARRRWGTATLERGVVLRGPLQNLQLGENTIIQSSCFLHLGGFEWCDYVGSLRIGRDSVLSPHCVIFACGPGGVTIGDRFDCGPGVGVFASRTDFSTLPRGRRFERVEIGDDVVVFANAVISPGVRIGDGAVVAAGSVVLADVPSGSFAAGAPARVVRSLARNDAPVAP